MSGTAHFEVFPQRMPLPAEQIASGPDGGTAETFRDWRWRLRAANGEIVAQSEGYTSEGDAKRGVEDAWRAARAAATEVRGGEYNFPKVEVVAS